MILSTSGGLEEVWIAHGRNLPMYYCTSYSRLVMFTLDELSWNSSCEVVYNWRKFGNDLGALILLYDSFQYCQARHYRD